MTTPAPAYSAPAAADTYPGKGLGIAGLVLAILLPLIGFILSLIARSQSKRAGQSNTPATVGIVLGIVFFVGQVIGGGLIIAGIVTAAQICGDLGNGIHEVGGVTYTCNLPA